MSSISLDRGGAVQQATLPSAEAQKSSQGLQGKVADGDVIITLNSTSAIQNSLEEMSLVANQFKSRTFDKRKAKSGLKLTDKIKDRIQKIQGIQKTQAFKDIVSKFSQQSNLNLKNILKQAEEFSDDLLEQYAMLDFAAEYFTEVGDKKKAEQINAARNAIRDKHPTLIRVGFNISEKAAEIIEREGISAGVRHVRESLADFVDDFPETKPGENLPSSIDHVRDDKTLLKSYRYLLSTFGREGFEKGRVLQLELLATNQLAEKIDVSPERVHAINMDMKTLKITGGIYDNCCEAEDQVERTHPDEQVKRDVLIEKMLGVVEQQWVTEGDFEKIPPSMNLNKLEAEILILTSVHYIVRSIPGEVFVNDETKQNVVAAISECLDGKIEDEESQDWLDDRLE